MTTTLDIPALSLVVLVGTSGSGKSTFAARHFAPTEILSSDFFRGLVADNENDQSASAEAFDALRYLAQKRLRAGRLTVIDATNVQPESRKPFVALARDHHCLPVAIVLDVPPRVAHDRNRTRPNRAFGEHVVQNQHRQLRRSLRHLKKEGFRHVHVLEGTDAIDTATITRTPLWTDHRHDKGPFDIIGDIHGCYDELTALLQKLDYPIDPETHTQTAPHPAGRRVIFLGDLVDRGPNIVGVLRLVKSMVESGHALAVPGNHEQKLVKLLDGKPVRLTHGLEQTKTQLEAAPDSATLAPSLRTFLDSLVSHYVLDDGNLVVAHAGLKEEFQNRSSGKVRSFCLYGDTTGETDDFGLPIRHDWAAEYRGRATVVYGHTPVSAPEWVNRTLCIDTGCVFGGALTALRYPERELVSVPAERVYYESTKPLTLPDVPARSDDLLDIDDVLGKRVLHTRIPGHSTITIRDENASAALEVMSRWAAPPEWLIYLPPTMSPSETSPDGPLLEHAREAFAYYQRQGIPTVVCQEKHMGSRAVVILCRDSAAAERRFHARDGRTGIVLTRTGRPFFATNTSRELDLEQQLLARLRTAADRTGFWTRFDTDWMCLDAELMPWSLKAEDLLRNQYAATATAATISLRAAIAATASASTPFADDLRTRADMIERYRTAYRRYSWPVASITDVRLAPFHLLATEGKVHVDQTHVWHMQTLSDLCAADPEVLLATPHRIVDLSNPESQESAITWWTTLTNAGGEGMVVKPLAFLAPGKRGLVQPAIKCRGPEYLRIIYGPEYTLPKHLERLRARGLSTKRGMALREFALGIEGLERFVEREPLYKVHECVFGVLAMDSEGVDPRL
jgi:protein phosphatase